MPSFLLIGMIFGGSRGMVAADRYVRSERWLKGHLSEFRSISGKKFGIVGLGKIGSSIARKAVCLGMSVMYTGPRAKTEPHRNSQQQKLPTFDVAMRLREY